MSSGKTFQAAYFERAFKLWASVCKLVLDGKRDLALVCQKLQEIVSDGPDREPWFRDWPAIKKIDFEPLRLMIALTDPESEAGRRLQRAFPEYYTGMYDNRGIPLSVLKYAASISPGAKNLARPNIHLQLTKVLDQFGIPYITVVPEDTNIPQPKDVFLLSHNEMKQIDLPVTPHDYEASYWGRVVDFRETRYFVADVAGWHEYTLVGASYIDWES